jgi:hypothetical protein
MNYKYSLSDIRFDRLTILTIFMTLTSSFILLYACKKNKNENRFQYPIAKEISSGIINRDSIASTDTGYYHVKVIPGKIYAFLLIELIGSGGSLTIYTDKSFKTIIAETALASASPKEVQLGCDANDYFIKVYNNNPNRSGKLLYHILVLEVSSLSSFINEGARGTIGNAQSIQLNVNTVRFSQVGTRSTSFYSISKKDTGHFTISIVGLTSDANLRVFPDETFTMETDCTLLRPPNGGNEPQQCTYPANKDYYIRVDEGGLNRNGAGFYLIVFHH